MNESYDTYITYDSLLNEVWEQDRNNQFKRCQRMRATMAIVVAVNGILAGLFFLLEVPFIVLSATGGLSLMVLLIVYLVSTYGGRKHLMYDLIYQRAIQLYNQEHDETYRYESRPKLDKAFNVDMGLFTRFATIYSNFRAQGLDPQNTPIVQQCRMVTSNGKSSQIHFDGIYIILPISGIPTQQLRSSGRPALKGIKMEKLEDYDMKAYRPQETPDITIHALLMGVYQELPDMFDIKHHYVGSNGSQVHVALWFKKQPSLPKTIEYHTLEELIDRPHRLLHYATELMHRFNDML